LGQIGAYLGNFCADLSARILNTCAEYINKIINIFKNEVKSIKFEEEYHIAVAQKDVNVRDGVALDKRPWPNSRDITRRGNAIVCCVHSADIDQ